MNTHFPRAASLELSGDIIKKSAVNPNAERLGAIALGDHAAFNELFAATRKRSFAIAYEILRSRDLAEDVVQEAYLTVWRNAGTFDPSRGSAEGWIATVVRNRALDVARSRLARPTEGEDELLSVASREPNAEVQMEAADERFCVANLIRSLNPKSRKLVLAAYVLGESGQQLSQRFGVPVGTVKVRLSRAVQKMRETLAAEADDPGLLPHPAFALTDGEMIARHSA